MKELSEVFAKDQNQNYNQNNCDNMNENNLKTEKKNNKGLIDLYYFPLNYLNNVYPKTIQKHCVIIALCFLFIVLIIREK